MSRPRETCSDGGNDGGLVCGHVCGHVCFCILLTSKSAQSDPLPIAFTCLFCNHEKSVAVKLDKKVGIGYLECKVCGQKFQCDINCTSTDASLVLRWS